MLESILNSKVKKAVLGILLLYPKRAFSPRELSLMARGPVRLVTECLRELLRVEAADSAGRKGKRYFRLNSHSPLLHELRELAFSPKPRFDDLVARRLRQIPDLRLAVLSGIFTLQMRLPVDVLLVGEGVNRGKAERAIEEIENIIGQETSYALLSREEYQERLFMNDRLIRDVLDHDHIVIFNTMRKP